MSSKKTKRRKCETKNSICDAIWNNDIMKLKLLIEQGEDINAVDSSGLKPLDMAIIKNNHEVIKLLVNEATKDKITVDISVWQNAISNGDNAVLTYLLRYHFRTLRYVTSPQGECPMHYAVLYKSIRSLKRFINLADINDATISGYTPLHYAVIGNDPKIIKILLRNKANISAKTVDGRSSLHFAVKHQCMESLNILLEYDINVDEPITTTGDTALHIAVENNDETMVELLIQSEANIHCKNNDGKNPLHVAVEQSFEKMVKLLLSKGFDVKQLTNEKFSPLTIALKQGNHCIAQMIYDHEPYIYIESDNSLLLKYSIECNDVYVSTRLLNKNSIDNQLTLLKIALEKKNDSIAQIIYFLCPEEYINNNYSWLLRYSIRYNNEYITMHLINKKLFNINKTNDIGETLLHTAASCSSKNIVSLLIEKGIDINKKTLDDLTALHYAFKNKHSDIIFRLLLNHGADINVITLKKESFLYLAVKEFRNYEITEELLIRGVNPNQFFDEKTVLQWVIIESDDHFMKMEKLLIKYGASTNKLNSNNDNAYHILFKYRCVNTRIPFVEFWVTTKTDINGINNDNETPLELCLQDGAYSGEVALLKKHGAGMTKNKSGETSLHLAIKMQEYNAVKIFLDDKSDINAPTLNGCTPLHYAVKYCDEKQKEMTEGYEKFFRGERILKILLENKCIPNIKDVNGKTPLHMAESRKFVKVTKLLIENGALGN